MTEPSTDEYGPWHRVRVGPRAAATDELVRGHDRDEAMANAERTWPWSTVTYVGVDDAFVEEPAVDWWGADYPSADQEPCLQPSVDAQEHVR